MRIDISQGHFLALNKAGITLNCLYILERCQNVTGSTISDLDDRSSLSAVATLQRKGYIDLKMKITKAGIALLDSLDTELVVAKRDVAKDSDFELWWETYPQTNFFTYKGKEFKGVQNKRIKKPECELLFKKFVAEGIPAVDIIAATQHHIETAKLLSSKKGENQLSFIPNAERYLRERCFVPFIGKEVKEEVTKTNETFI